MILHANNECQICLTQSFTFSNYDDQAGYIYLDLTPQKERLAITFVRNSHDNCQFLDWLSTLAGPQW